ncbi:transposon Tf2-9 polyprotein [Trichonephila clavipes]|nr:transposon Tf2-9 polyprotein [Trichonephila clavipes]
MRSFWQSFEFDIIFRKTIEHGNADFLSRLPKTSEELEVKDDITIFRILQIEALPVTSKELRQETYALQERILCRFCWTNYTNTRFLIVDAHSKWLEVYPMKVTTTKKTIECLRDSFARFGLPRDKLRRDNFEFRDRKFDVGDRVAVRVYRAANTRWKFGTIVNQDGVLHYIIDVQGTLVRRHVDQIRPVGDKVQENIIPLMHQRFPSSEVRENNSNIQHAETAEDISKDRNKELGSSSVQGVPSADVAVSDLSQSSAKETDSRRESTSSRQAIS